MSKIIEAYHNATSLPVDSQVVVEPTNSGSQLDEVSKLSWKNHPTTREYLEDIHEQIVKLTDDCIALAVNYPQTKNHELIIQKLVRIDVLRQQIAYARR